MNLSFRTVRRARAALVPGALALLLSACADPARTVAGTADPSCDTRAYSEIGGPIALTNQDGVAMTEADFAGRHALVFFGFTYCPDVCPMTLVKIRRALDLLPEGTERPVTVLVSIDPERDTPASLRAYVETAAFPEDTIGLTGSVEAVKAASDAFKASFARVDDPSSAAGYTMDHTSIIYLMGPDWSLETFFTHDATPEQVAGCLAKKL